MAVTRRDSEGFIAGDGSSGSPGRPVPGIGDVSSDLSSSQEHLVIPAAKKPDKSRQVIVELFKTESLYCADIKTLLTDWSGPLKEIISERDHQTLFPASIQSIIQTNAMLLDKLRAATARDAASPAQDVARALHEVAPFLKMYSDYSTNYAEALVVLDRLKKSGKASSFLKSQQAALPGGLDLNSYLIKPIQRILKYPLLLRELLHNVDASDTRTREVVSAALEELGKIAETINEKQREAESQKKMADIQKELSIALLSPARRYLGEGDCTFAGETVAGKYFLFNDLLVLARRKKQKGPLSHKATLDLQMITVRPGSNPNVVDVTVGSKTYNLDVASADKRTQLLQKLEEGKRNYRAKRDSEGELINAEGEAANAAHMSGDDSESDAPPGYPAGAATWGIIQKKSDSGLARWQSLFCVLTPTHLHFYKSQKSLENKEKAQSVEEVAGREVGLSKKKTYAFFVRKASEKKELLLAASTEEERNGWMDALVARARCVDLDATNRASGTSLVRDDTSSDQDISEASIASTDEPGGTPSRPPRMDDPNSSPRSRRGTRDSFTSDDGSSPNLARKASWDEAAPLGASPEPAGREVPVAQPAVVPARPPRPKSMNITAGSGSGPSSPSSDATQRSGKHPLVRTESNEVLRIVELERLLQEGRDFADALKKQKDAEIGALKTELAAAQASGGGDLRAQLDEAVKAKDDAEKRLAALNGVFTELKESQKKKIAEVNQLKKDLMEAKKKRAQSPEAVREDLGLLSQQLDDLRRKLASETAALTRERSGADTLRAELAHMVERLEQEAQANVQEKKRSAQLDAEIVRLRKGGATGAAATSEVTTPSMARARFGAAVTSVTRSDDVDRLTKQLALMKELADARAADLATRDAEIARLTRENSELSSGVSGATSPTKESVSQPARTPGFAALRALAEAQATNKPAARPGAGAKPTPGPKPPVGPKPKLASLVSRVTGLGSRGDDATSPSQGITSPPPGGATSPSPGGVTSPAPGGVTSPNVMSPDKGVLSPTQQMHSSPPRQGNASPPGDELERLRQELLRTKEECEMLRAALAVRDGELAELRTQLGREVTRAMEMQGEAERLQAELARNAAPPSEAALMDAVARLTQDVELLRCANEDMGARLREQEGGQAAGEGAGDATRLRADVARLEGELAAARAQPGATVGDGDRAASLASELGATKAQLQATEDELIRLDSELANARVKLAELPSPGEAGRDTQELHIRVIELEGELARVREQLEEVQDANASRDIMGADGMSVTELRTEHARITEELSRAQEMVVRVRMEGDSARAAAASELARAQEELERARGPAEEAERTTQELERVRAQLADARAALDERGAAAASAEGADAALRSEVERMRSERDEAFTRVTQVVADHQLTLGDLAKARTELAGERTLRTAAEEALAEEHRESARLTDELADAQKQANSARRQARRSVSQSDLSGDTEAQLTLAAVREAELREEVAHLRADLGRATRKLSESRVKGAANKVIGLLRQGRTIDEDTDSAADKPESDPAEATSGSSERVKDLEAEVERLKDRVTELETGETVELSRLRARVREMEGDISFASGEMSRQRARIAELENTPASAETIKLRERLILSEGAIQDAARLRDRVAELEEAAGLLEEDARMARAQRESAREELSESQRQLSQANRRQRSMSQSQSDADPAAAAAREAEMREELAHLRADLARANRKLSEQRVQGTAQKMLGALRRAKVAEPDATDEATAAAPAESRAPAGGGDAEEVAALRDRVAELESGETVELSRLRERVREMEGDITQASGEMSRQRTRIAYLESTASSAENRVQQLESDLAVHNTETQRLRDRVHFLEASAALEASAVRGANANADETAQLINRLHQRIGELEDALGTGSAELTRLRMRTSELERGSSGETHRLREKVHDLEAALAARSAAGDDIAVLRAKVSDLERTLEAREHEASKARTEREAAQLELAEAAKQLSQANRRQRSMSQGSGDYSPAAAAAREAELRETVAHLRADLARSSRKLSEARLKGTAARVMASVRGGGGEADEGEAPDETSTGDDASSTGNPSALAPAPAPASAEPALRARIAELERTVAERDEDLAAARGAAARAAEERVEMIRRLAGSAAMEDLERERAAREMEVEAMRDQLRRQQQRTVTELAARETAERKVAEAATENASLRDEVLVLNGQLAGAKEDHAETTKALNKMRWQLAKQSKTGGTSPDKSGDLAEVVKAAQRRAEMEEEIEHLRADLARTTRKLSNTRIELDAARSGVAAVAGGARSVGGLGELQLTLREEDIHSSEHDLVDPSSATAMLADKDKELSALRKELAAVKEELAAEVAALAPGKVAEKAAELRRLRKENADLRARLQRDMTPDEGRSARADPSEDSVANRSFDDNANRSYDDGESSPRLPAVPPLVVDPVRVSVSVHDDAPMHASQRSIASDLDVSSASAPLVIEALRSEVARLSNDLARALEASNASIGSGRLAAGAALAGASLSALGTSSASVDAVLLARENEGLRAALREMREQSASTTAGATRARSGSGDGEQHVTALLREELGQARATLAREQSDRAAKIAEKDAEIQRLRDSERSARDAGDAYKRESTGLRDQLREGEESRHAVEQQLRRTAQLVETLRADLKDARSAAASGDVTALQTRLAAMEAQSADRERLLTAEKAEVAERLKHTTAELKRTGAQLIAELDRTRALQSQVVTLNAEVKRLSDALAVATAGSEARAVQITDLREQLAQSADDAATRIARREREGAALSARTRELETKLARQESNSDVANTSASECAEHRAEIRILRDELASAAEEARARHLAERESHVMASSRIHDLEAHVARLDQQRADALARAVAAETLLADARTENQRANEATRRVQARAEADLAALRDERASVAGAQTRGAEAYASLSAEHSQVLSEHEHLSDSVAALTRSSTEATQRLSEALRERDDARASLAASRADAARADDLLASAMARADRLKQEVADVTQTYSARVSAREGEAARLRTELEASKARCSSLEESLDDANISYQKAEREVAALTEEVQKLERQMAAQRDKMERMRTEQDAETARVRAEGDARRAQVLATTSSESDAEAIEKLRAELSAVSQENAILVSANTRLKAVERDHDSLVATHEALREKHAQLAVQNTEAARALSGVREDNAALKFAAVEVERLRESNALKERRLLESYGENDHLKERVAALLAEMATTREAAIKQENAAARLQSQLSSATTKLAETTERAVRAEEAVRSHEDVRHVQLREQLQQRLDGTSPERARNGTTPRRTPDRSFVSDRMLTPGSQTRNSTQRSPLRDVGTPGSPALRYVAAQPGPAVGLAVATNKRVHGARGAVVLAVTPGLPGQLGGVRVDDIILSLGGVATPSRSAFTAVLRKCPMLEPVSVEVVRGEQRIVLSVAPWPEGMSASQYRRLSSLGVDGNSETLADLQSARMVLDGQFAEAVS